MLTIACLFLARDASTDKIFDRIVAYRTANPSMSVNFTVSNGKAQLNAHMTFDHDARCLVHFYGSGVNDWYSSTPEVNREVNFPIRTYDDLPGRPEIAIPPSRIGPFTHVIPGWLPIPDMRKVFPGNAKYSLGPPEKDDGFACDVIHTHIAGQMGATDIDIAVDASGLVRRFKSVSSGMGQRVELEWRFSRFEPLIHPTAAAFRVDIPLGFVPYGLPEVEGPIVTGQTFPRQGWRATSGGPLNVGAKLGSRGGLVAVLGVGSEPSDLARASLGRLKASVPVVILSDGTKAAPATDGCDPSGKLIAQVAPPDTPLFLLLDAKGKIKREWMGYDADHAAKFETEVAKAYKSP